MAAFYFRRRYSPDLRPSEKIEGRITQALCPDLNLV